MQNIEIKYSISKIIKYCLISLIFVIGSIYILVTVIDHYDDIGYQSTKLLRYKNLSIIISLAGIIFFGSTCCGFLHTIITKRTMYLSLQGAGITIYSLTGSILIYWNEVNYITMATQFNEIDLIAINVRNRNKFKKRLPYFKRLLMGINKRTDYSININLTMIKEKPEEVLAIMNKHWDEWKKNNEQR